MYDRKTWVVLALCGCILAANVYYSSQIKVEEDKKRAAEAALKAQLEPAADEPAVTNAGLTVEAPPPPTEEETVTLENNEVVFTFTNFGGGLKHADLKRQLQVHSTIPVRINQFGGGPVGAIGGTDDILPNLTYAYKADESVQGKSVVYIAKLPSGLIAKKTFSLVQGDAPGTPYLLDFQIQFENGAANDVNLSQWSLFLGEASPLYQAEVAQQTGYFWRADHSIHFQDGGKFKGGWFSSEKPLLKSDATDPIEFAGVTNQFFTTVLQPKEPFVSNLWARHEQVTLAGATHPVTAVRAGLQLPAASLKPAESKVLDFRIFVGPKHNPMLRKMESHWGEGWGDVMQYGWFSIVSRTLNTTLNWYHALFDKFAKNWAWGLAIILLTVTVRIVIWPLAAKATHTMKRMSKLQPEMAKIKEKYPDDPNKVNTETMALYRKYGINPLGGCLPMLIQIPIFFGFYRMLQYAVELRGAPFLWVHDLSQPDTLFHISFLGNVPFNVLPIVMAITSFLQIKMTPKAGDPTQQKIMMLMPFMFFFFCYNFASALALYWTTQNIFQIGQTWLMNRIPEPELKPVANGGKKSWVQRMAERQAEMQRLQKEGKTGGLRDVTPDKDKKKPRPPRTGG